MYIDFLSPPQRIALAQFVRLFSLKLLFSQLLPLAAGCDDKMRLADEKNRDQGLSTRRRNRVLTKIHLIYSVIHAPAASNEHSKWSSPPSRGRSAGGKIFVPPPIQLLSRGIPPLSPSDSAAFHPNWPPASAHIYPGSNPAASSSDSFSRIWSSNESWQTREEGIINFLSLKKTRLTHIC